MSAPGNTERTCPRCDKPGEFYAGNSACKECVKARVRANYKANREHYLAYDRMREQRPERKVQRRTGTVTTRSRYPEKYRARTAVGNAIRDGRLVKKPCEGCGDEKVDAHHEDYSKPLEVIWFCRACHHRHHNEERKAA